jgi:hypothetical protein
LATCPRTAWPDGRLQSPEPVDSRLGCKYGIPQMNR